AWAGAGAWALAWAGAGAGAGAGAWDWAWAILGGGIVGYLSPLGIWWGMGIGLLSFIQFFLVFAGLGSSGYELKKKYREFKVFIILGVVSTLGILTGGLVGWLLTLSGVRLPTT
ncbi:MAG: hypothetical protein AAGA46_09020, partial [Cyanobacteria bacterium P01_F01_bin.13]